MRWAAISGFAALMLWCLAFLRPGEVHGLWSDALGEQRHYSVYLPHGYDKTERYPVIYSLDGEKYRHGAIFAANARMLAALGLAPDVILVAVHSEGKRTRDYAPPVGGAAFAAFLGEELLPIVQATVPNAVEPQILSGHSYGGLFTVYMYSQHSGLFDVHLAIVPSFFYDEAVVDTLKSRLHKRAEESLLFVYSGLESERYWGPYEKAVGYVAGDGALTSLDTGFFPLPHSLIMFPAQLEMLTHLDVTQ